MEALQIFNNPDFGEIRVIEIEGEPWFVAVDVCRALDIQNHRDALTRLDDDEKSGVVLTDPHGRPQETSCVNEPGLYSLVLGSRKPEAKAFKRWITHEVLPAIRKTGSYSMPNMSDELKAIFMLDSRTVEHDRRITALEEHMVIDYNQQRILANHVNAVVVEALGGAKSNAYSDKSVRAKAYSECNHDIQNWFNVNSRNNIPKMRFDESVDYVKSWHPSTNLSLLIQQTNQQTKI